MSFLAQRPTATLGIQPLHWWLLPSLGTKLSVRVAVRLEAGGALREIASQKAVKWPYSSSLLCCPQRLARLAPVQEAARVQRNRAGHWGRLQAPTVVIEVQHLSNLSKEEAIEMGSTIGALIGLGIEGEDGAEKGAALGAEAAATDGVEVFSDEDAWDVLEEIPNDSAAALVLLEHHWAIPLRDAVANAGGFRISDGFISPLDLVEVGLISAEEAQALHASETQAAVN